MIGLFGAPREPAWPEPRLLGDIRVRILVTALLLVPFFVPIPVELRRNVLIATLGDRLHMVLLAGVALVLYWRGPLRGRLIAAALTAALVGGAIELLQELVGRTALFHDFILDVMGITVVVGWVLWRGHGRRVGLLLVGVMIVTTGVQLRKLPPVMVAAAAARERFPIIEDCRRNGGQVIWAADNDGVVTYMAADRGAAEPCLRLDGAPPSHWPSVTMRRFPHDWQDYDTFEFRVRVAATEAGADTVRFGVRLDDFTGVHDGDWLSRGFDAVREWRTVSMPIADQVTRWTERPFDLADVDKITFFLVDPSAPRSLEFTDIRLR